MKYSYTNGAPFPETQPPENKYVRAYYSGRAADAAWRRRHRSTCHTVGCENDVTQMYHECWNRDLGRYVFICSSCWKDQS